MSNILTENPLVLDTAWTAGTIPAALKPPTGTSDTTNTRNNGIHAIRIEWFKPVTANDTFSITDINGNVLLKGSCETAGVSQVLWTSARQPLKLKMGGWVLSQISSGQIIIWY